MYEFGVATIAIFVLFAQIKQFAIFSELVKIRKLLEEESPSTSKVRGVRIR